LTITNWFFFFSDRLRLPIIGQPELAMIGMIFHALLIILYFRIQSD
jgi:hypothetical protein